MIKKLMNLSGVQVLNDVDQKMILGGDGWVAVCGNGERISVGCDDEMAVIGADIVCNGNIDFIYSFSRC